MLSKDSFNSSRLLLLAADPDACARVVAGSAGVEYITVLIGRDVDIEVDELLMVEFPDGIESAFIELLTDDQALKEENDVECR